MSSIYSSELHGNENASISFGAAIHGIVLDVRSAMADLAQSRKADEYAPGAVHALRKLCEGEKDCGGIHRGEVEEWHTAFLAWFDHVKRFFPAKHAKKFLANVEEDFRVILAASEQLPEYYWRADSEERHIRVTFKNNDALEAAHAAAEEKHPVDLGNALHKYIDACIDRLVGKKPRTKDIANDTEDPPLAVFAPKVTIQEGSWQLWLDQFDCFDTVEDVEQDIVINAYELEDAVKNYLSANHAAAAKAIRYDCESSLFSVHVSNPSALTAIFETLLLFAKDHPLFAQYRVRGRGKKKGKAKR